MRRWIVLTILATAVALLAASPAYAWWGWTTGVAERTLRDEGLTWDTGHENVQYADCEGRPPRFRQGGKTYWRNFRCYVETDAAAGENHYFIRVAVKGKYKWKYGFLEYTT
jgi:hypothetical protein